MRNFWVEPKQTKSEKVNVTLFTALEWESDDERWDKGFEKELR